MDKENKAHYPLVLVTWVDCTTFRGWHSVEESLKFEPDECQTAGFLLKEGPTFLCLSPSLSGTGDTVTTLDPMMIPMSWVTKVAVLGLVSSCGCGEKEEVGCVDEDCQKGHRCICVEGVEQVPQDADCWDAPDPEHTTLLEEYQMGLITEERAQELLQPTNPIQPIKGDEALDRPLTLDEHIRRGGTYATWPGLIENVEGPGPLSPLRKGPYLPGIEDIKGVE